MSMSKYATPADYWEAEARRNEMDAERYRWLRAQRWNDGLLAVVADPRDAVKLGYDCPSRDRLDDAVDAAMATARPACNKCFSEKERVRPTK